MGLIDIYAAVWWECWKFVTLGSLFPKRHSHGHAEPWFFKKVGQRHTGTSIYILSNCNFTRIALFLCFILLIKSIIC